jgi:hypothetical protein
MTPQGYKEKVSNEEVVNIIQSGIVNSVGDWLNSAELARERVKSSMEYGMLPVGHLSPQGVSQIVSSDTVEAVEGYLAILSELLLNNNKIARFCPVSTTPTDRHKAKVAADLVNYTIFKQNPGWDILNSWMKASLLWKNSIVRWDFVEDFQYKIIEFEEIDQNNLDLELADDDTEIVSYAATEPRTINLPDGTQEVVYFYLDVRLRRRINKSRVRINNVPPEGFRITRDATSLDNAQFVGIQFEMTRSEIRKNYPNESKDIDWDRIGDGSPSWATKYTEDAAARKNITGQEYWQGGHNRELVPTEANRNITLVECWIKVDRDGDGIAELKHFITAGDYILLEEDAECIPLASLVPFEVPFEFFGLSVADMIRPSTLASTAILRGFVENVYLTNYSPKLADPNVVDFSALQNMKPKQLIATNGNPNAAVAALTPDTISTGTVPLLEALQLHKEQATGLSKAAQGLNDTLFVSGNSEEKMQMAVSAAQIRIQYMARRFTETGFKRLVEGVYKMLKDHLSGIAVDYYDEGDVLHSVDPAMLPDNMIMYIDADVGEHSNSNTIKKMQIVGGQLLPALRDAGAGGAIQPVAALNIAAKTLEALDLDPLDYIVDYTTEDFKSQAEQDRQKEVDAGEKAKRLEEERAQLEMEQIRAAIALTNIQSQNAIQDNTRQLMVALDKSHQEWAKLYIAAAKEGIEPPKAPEIKELLQIATDYMIKDASIPKGAPTPNVQGPAASLPQM